MTESSALSNRPALQEVPNHQKAHDEIVDTTSTTAMQASESTNSLANSSNSSFASSSNSTAQDETPASTATATSVTTTRTKSRGNSSSSSNNNNNKANHRQLIKQQQEAALQALLLEQLAKQLAYYFSAANLQQDTYLQTLQKLNQGCVPVSILANFAKVKALLWATPALTNRYLQESARQEMILRAVRQQRQQESDSSSNSNSNNTTALLQLEQIDTATGRIVKNDSSSSATSRDKVTTIWAVRPACSQVVEQKQLEEQQRQEAASKFTNTILFRDVKPVVTKEDILHLFTHEMQDAPSVISANQDVANCWYVVVDTNSHETMLNLVLQLRCLTLAGEYIQCRLKPCTLHQAPSIDPVVLAAASVQQAANKKKKKNRGSRKKKRAGATATAAAAATTTTTPSTTRSNANQKKSNQHKAQQGKKKNSNKDNNKTSAKKAEASSPKPPPPPTLGEEDFPTLFESKTVEWATSLSEYKGLAPHGGGEDSSKSAASEDEDEEQTNKGLNQKTLSDGASTATTASSSTEPRKPTLAGYAAAVLKEPIAAATALSRNNTAAESSELETRVVKSAKKQKAGDATVPQPKPVDSPPVAWGRGRSFAEAARSSA